MNTTNNRPGGLACVEKHGLEHMRQIGKLGAQSLHRKYLMYPVGINKFVYVPREVLDVRQR